MMQNPLDLSQADLSGLMEVGQTVADVSSIGGSNSPLGGVGELLNTVERILNVWGQVNHKVNESRMTIAKLRGMIDPQAQGGSIPSGQVVDATVYRPVDSPPITLPSPDEPPKEPEPAPAPTVEPMRLYATMLRYLKDVSEAFPELTMAEALELARSQKTLIINAIEEELPKLLNSDDRATR